MRQRRAARLADQKVEEQSGGASEMVEQYATRAEDVAYATAEDEDFHKDGRIYDYDFLVAQNPITVVPIPSVDTLMGDGRFSRSGVVASGKRSVQGIANEKGHKEVKNVYTGRTLTITNNSIRHGLNGNKQRLLANAQIGMVIGNVVENGIPVNGLIPTDGNALQTYAMVTPCITEDGKQMMAVTHVDIQKNEVSSVTFTDIVHSANGRIYKNSEPVSDTIDVEGENPYHPSRYTISISDLLKEVNISFKSLLSQDVLEHLEEERPENGTYSDKVMYSTRDLPEGVSVREYLGAMKPTGSMTETKKDMLGRYQRKLAELQEKEHLAEEQDEIIKTAPTIREDGKPNEDLLKAKNRYKIYRQQANRIARELARYERSEGFAGLMATSRAVVSLFQEGSTGSVADAQDALETEIKNLTDRLKEIGNTVEGTAQGDFIQGTGHLGVLLVISSAGGG